MNQIPRFCVCRSSLLRRNPFTRWSSKPIYSSSSLISNNPTSSNLITLVSRFHHTPQFFSTPGNHVRRSIVAEYSFGDDPLRDELYEIREAIEHARKSIELGTLPDPFDAVWIPKDKLDALKERFDLPLDDEDRKSGVVRKSRIDGSWIHIQLLGEALNETRAFAR
ncbi:hypothetical protein MKW94_029582, partial [Papaver nudicaule]|nr:hypothetical protein [Papaver nudicaule]